VTRGLEQAYYCGIMIGEIEGRVLSSANMRIGDWILMTKTAELRDRDPRIRIFGTVEED